MKRILALFITLVMLFSLTACRGDDENPAGTGTSTNDTGTNLGGHESELPETILGTWYPHPEVSNALIEINSDGICNLDGQNLSYEVESATEDDVTLIAGEHYLIFSNLRTSLPVLSISNYGYCVKELELWKSMTDWYNPSTGGAFTLSLEELAQSGCNLLFDDGNMTVEVLENDQITYIVKFSGAQAEITTPDGNSIVYYPTDGSGFADNGSGNSDDPQAIYDQAVKDLQSVLAGGYMTDYVNSDGSHHVISGVEAYTKLYKTFESLQQSMDVSDYLNRFQKIDNVLLQTSNDNSVATVSVKFKYNAFGQPMKVTLNQSEHFGNYISYAYDENGNISQVSVLGALLGEPIFDNTGKLTGVKVEIEYDGDVTVATLTYNSRGQITKVVMPRSTKYAGDTKYGNYPDLSEEHYFYYDENGRMIQRTSLLCDKELKYLVKEAFLYDERIFEKDIAEFQYDADGRLISKHNYISQDDGRAINPWSFSKTEYAHQNSLLTEMHTEFFTLHIESTSAGEIEQESGIILDTVTRIFKTEGLIKAEKNKVLDAVSEHIHYNEQGDGTPIYFSSRYEYGSIYVYTPEG